MLVLFENYNRKLPSLKVILNVENLIWCNLYLKYFFEIQQGCYETMHFRLDNLYVYTFFSNRMKNSSRTVLHMQNQRFQYLLLGNYKYNSKGITFPYSAGIYFRTVTSTYVYNYFSLDIFWIYYYHYPPYIKFHIVKHN